MDNNIAQGQERQMDDAPLVARANKPSSSNGDENKTCLFFSYWPKFCHAGKALILKTLIVASKWSAQNPWTTVVLSLLMSMTLAAVGFATRFEMENEGEILWTPTGCNSLLHSQWIEKSGFSQRGRDIQVLIHANGRNVLDYAGVQRVFDVVETIRGIPGYREACAIGKDKDLGNQQGTSSSIDCPTEAVTGFWQGHERSVFEEAVSTEQDVRVQVSQLKYANGEPVNRLLILGQPQPPLPPVSSISNSTTTADELLLESVAAFMTIVTLPPDEGAVRDFEAKVQTALFDMREDGMQRWVIYQMEIQTQRSFDDELLRAIQEDVPLMTIAFIGMGAFCALTLAKRDKVRSQSILGIGAVLTIFLSLLSGYGLAALGGVPFTSLGQIFPYVMLGIGLDDTFIITGAYARTNPKEEVEDRIEKVMEEVGLSISVSTSTTFFAFLLGGMASLPGIRWFAWYSAPTVMFDFFYQVTFFVALLKFDALRQEANRRDCCPCCLAPAQQRIEEDNEIVFESIALPSEHCESNKDNEVPTNELMKDSFTNFRDGRFVLEDSSEASTGGDSQKLSRLLTKIVERYADFILRPIAKVSILVFFTALLVVGAWGASQQSQEFDFRVLMPPDSYVTTYFSALDFFFSGGVANSLLASHCYFREIDVSDKNNQDAMISFVEDMGSLPNVQYFPSQFWLLDFQRFAENDEVNQLEFFDQVDLFLATEPYNIQYQNDVVRNEEGIITASRAFFQLVNVTLYDHQSQTRVLHAQTEIAENQWLNEGLDAVDWPLFSFGRIYNAWELYDVIIQEVLQMVTVGLVSVFLIALIFIPHPIGSLIVTPVVAMIYVELVGFLHFVGVTINSVSAVGLTMSIGLVVDYNAHIVMTYFESTDGATRDDRVRHVINTMGKSIMLGGISTFLGVVPLSLSSSEVFRNFFYIFLGIVGFGASHGLVLTPVLLSLIGPFQHSQEEQRGRVNPTTCAEPKAGKTMELQEDSIFEERVRAVSERNEGDEPVQSETSGPCLKIEPVDDRLPQEEEDEHNARNAEQKARRRLFYSLEPVAVVREAVSEAGSAGGLGIRRIGRERKALYR